MSNACYAQATGFPALLKGAALEASLGDGGDGDAAGRRRASSPLDYSAASAARWGLTDTWRWAMLKTCLAVGAPRARASEP